jgi:hypothetical protein
MAGAAALYGVGGVVFIVRSQVRKSRAKMHLQMHLILILRHIKK